VRRYKESVREDEVHFQPGTFLVRASAIQPLVGDRKDESTEDDEPEEGGQTEPTATVGDGERATDGRLGSVRMRIGNVPSTKAREFVRAVVLPLAKDYSKVTLEVTIRAEGGEGASRGDLDLTVLEGLRQLGIDDVDIQDGE
jgi:hypothetical protein